MDKLYVPKWMKILRHVNANCMTDIGKLSGVSYVYVIRKLVHLEDFGLVKSKVIGRMKLFSKTNDGIYISENIDNIMRLIKNG